MALLEVLYIDWMLQRRDAFGGKADIVARGDLRLTCMSALRVSTE